MPIDKKIIVLLLTATLLAPSLHAQRRKSSQQGLYRHEISLRPVGYGLAAMPFASKEQSWKNDLDLNSYGAGIAYTYWRDNLVGFSVGLSLRKVSQSHSLGEFKSSSPGTISMHDANTTRTVQATFNTSTPGVSEIHHYTMLEVPLQVTLSRKHLYAAAGLSLATAIAGSGSYAYDPSTYHVTILDDLGNVQVNPGVAADIVEERTGSINLASSRPYFAMVNAEIGYRFFLARHHMLTISAYGSLALNRYHTSADHLVFDISDTRSVAAIPSETDLTSGFRYYHAGLALTYHIGLGEPLFSNFFRTGETPIQSNLKHVKSLGRAFRAR